MSTQQKTHGYRESESVIAPNYLRRQFCVDQPDQIWCGDVTYVRSGQRWFYLATVLDLYKRKVVGWACSVHPDTKLTVRALRMAYESRQPSSGLMFHSDQGSHYTSHAFRQKLS